MMDFFAQAIFLKVLLILGLLVVAIWGVCLFIKQIQCLRSSQKVSKLTRILDTCYLDSGRKLFVFTCPFGQGVILASSRKDHIVLFGQNANVEMLEKAN